MAKMFGFFRLFFVLLGMMCSFTLFANGHEPTITERNGDTIQLRELKGWRRQRGLTREQMYRCKTCGQVFDEKDLRGHSNYYGHYDFEPYGY